MKDADLRRAGIGLAVLLAVLNLFSGHERGSFDAYVHMFFADHYYRDWFNLWEPRWYSGFLVTSYPPLSHQTLALFLPFLSHEHAYALLTALVMVALPLAVHSFSKSFTDSRTAAIAMILVAVWPVPQRVAYLYGQLPTMYSAVLVLLALRQLDLYLTGRGRGHVVAYGFLLGAMAGAHHQTLLFGAFGSVVVGVAHLIFSPQRQLRVLRLMIAGPTAALAVILVAWPLIMFGAQGPQTEIPHFSRESIFERVITLDYVQQVGSAVLMFVATIVLFVKGRKREGLFAAAASFLFVISFGDTTPLPNLMFGAMARYFVYDRFTFWGCLLGAAAMAAALGRLKRVDVLVFLMLPIALLTVGYREAFRQPPYIQDLSPLLSVLNQEGAEKYRHLTLGFGDQLCRLSLHGKSPNIDGDYHAARRSLYLQKSAIPAVDTAKFFANGPDTLRYVLAHGDEQSLRWVFVYDDWYYPFLLEAGFSIAEIWPNGVTLFERSEAPPIAEQPPSERGASAIGWGVLPLLCLAVSALLLIRLRKQEGEGAREE